MPIILMTYLETGELIEISNLVQLKSILIENGWTLVTAICTMIIFLIHWPCSTTCLTIKKETGSLKWTFLSIALPTFIGMFVCFVIASVGRIIGI